MKRIAQLLFFVLMLSLVACTNNSSSVKTDSFKIPEEVLDLPIGILPGERAAEIELPNQVGELKKLSDLQGKVVLVDFWASWCTPCRKENPELLKVYAEYHGSSFTLGEGFEIFSVSLDKNEEAWKGAITADGMIWPYNLCNMMGAHTDAAIAYGVQMIPANFLLDQNGVIIASNLRGEALSVKLSALIQE